MEVTNITNMIKRKELSCSFCGKNEAKVLKLVAGPRVYICDKCVAIASQIMNDSPDDNQPPRVQPSVWRKLLSRAQRFLRGGEARRVSSLGVSS
jgi:ATP-dependent protease Clp ATPase subunit